MYKIVEGEVLDACFGLLVLLGVVLVMLYLGIPVWLIFVFSAFLLSFLVGGLPNVYEVFVNTLGDSNTWDLVVIMYLIAVFVYLYRVSGAIKDLGRELMLVIGRPRLVSVLVPAILGLLPVPGGALMSAPIVDEVGEYLGIDRVKKLFVNVWFRHVIFVVYPLSSVLVLTSILTGTSVWSLIEMQLPVMLIMIIVGYVIGLTRLQRQPISWKTLRGGNRVVLLKLFSPIIASITIALILSPFIDYRYNLPLNRLSMIIGIATGITILYIQTSSTPKTLLRIISSRETIELAMIGFSAMLLRKTLMGLDLGCFVSISQHTNPLILVVLVPAIFSFVTGVNTTSIALSVPIIARIIDLTPPIASLLFVSAYISYIASPLHLCLIYSAKYYGVNITKSYKYLAPATITSLLLSTALYILLHLG